MIKAKRDEILTPLAAVSGIIERRHTLPILSNVLIEAGPTLSFLATDIEIQITARTTLQPSGESRGVTVGARKLVDILRALPDNADLTLQQQDKRLLVKAGKSRFTLQTLPAEDFPRLAKPSGEAARFSLSQKALRRLLGLVQYAMAQQDIRYYLNGLLMVVEDGHLKLVATDGHRLAMIERAVPTAVGFLAKGIIVPRKGVAEIRKLCDEGEGSVDLGLGDGFLMVRRPDLLLTTRLIDGEFPNYRQLLPEATESRLTVSRQQLVDAVRRVGLLARDTTPVRMEFNALGVKLSSSSPDLGQAVETVEARYEGEDLTVAFNPQYLADGLNAATGETVRLDVRDGLKPGVVHGEGDEFTYLVMPVRLPAAVS